MQKTIKREHAYSSACKLIGRPVKRQTIRSNTMKDLHGIS
jgi:hypothetical protein